MSTALSILACIVALLVLFPLCVTILVWVEMASRNRLQAYDHRLRLENEKRLRELRK